MIARYRCGQQAEALAAGREVRRVLATELGIEPGAELIELERQVLSQDPALHAPTASLVNGDAGSARTEGLPRGVVTVLMTDVESSSVLWDEHPAQMSQALARQECADLIGVPAKKDSCSPRRTPQSRARSTTRLPQIEASNCSQ